MYGNYITFFFIFLKFFFFLMIPDSFKSIATDSLQIFIFLNDMLSYPCDLLESNDLTINSISLFVRRKEFILVLVLYKRGGIILLFLYIY